MALRISRSRPSRAVASPISRGLIRQFNSEGTLDELLERLGLTAFAEANPYTLSGGQQRRLSVATALATRPRVLVLDGLEQVRAPRPGLRVRDEGAQGHVVLVEQLVHERDRLREDDRLRVRVAH